MSDSTASGACGAIVAAEQLPLELRPERASPAVEEKKGSDSCTLRYYVQQVEGNDQVRWTIEDTDDGNVYIRFEVKRHQSERLVYLHKSKTIPASLNLRENLIIKKGPIINTKKKFYKLELKKEVDFNLTQHFTPPSPPSSAVFP